MRFKMDRVFSHGKWCDRLVPLLAEYPPGSDVLTIDQAVGTAGLTRCELTRMYAAMWPTDENDAADVLLNQIGATLAEAQRCLGELTAARSDGPAIKFDIGPAVYVVRRVRGLRLDGEAVQGLIDCDKLIIAVDDEVLDRTVVEDILRHEHAHAWEWHVGKPGGAEQRAQWVATVGATFDRDLRRAGGLTAFYKLPVVDAAGTRST